MNTALTIVGVACAVLMIVGGIAGFNSNPELSLCRFCFAIYILGTELKKAVK